VRSVPGTWRKGVPVSWVEPQNQGRRFVSGLASKLVATVCPDLTSKPAVGFLVEPQN
jgi:hypothetical protein